MSEHKRLTVAEAALVARRHPVTMRRALESGELHGTQRVAGGRWTIKSKCLDAWADGERCEHQLTVSQRGHLRAIGGGR